MARNVWHVLLLLCVTAGMQQPNIAMNPAIDADTSETTSVFENPYFVCGMFAIMIGAFAVVFYEKYYDVYRLKRLNRRLAMVKGDYCRALNSWCDLMVFDVENAESGIRYTCERYVPQLIATGKKITRDFGVEIDMSCTDKYAQDAERALCDFNEAKTQFDRLHQAYMETRNLYVRERLLEQMQGACGRCHDSVVRSEDAAHERLAWFDPQKFIAGDIETGKKHQIVDLLKFQGREIRLNLQRIDAVYLEHRTRIAALSRELDDLRRENSALLQETARISGRRRGARRVS